MNEKTISGLLIEDDPDDTLLLMNLMAESDWPSFKFTFICADDLESGLMGRKRGRPRRSISFHAASTRGSIRRRLGGHMTTTGERTRILMVDDVNMPGADGFALCRRIRQHVRFAGLPILFLTASKEDANFIKGWEAGGTRYLTKPVARSELLTMLDNILFGQRPEAPPGR